MVKLALVELVRMNFERGEWNGLDTRLNAKEPDLNDQALLTPHFQEKPKEKTITLHITLRKTGRKGFMISKGAYHKVCK